MLAPSSSFKLTRACHHSSVYEMYQSISRTVLWIYLQKDWYLSLFFLNPYSILVSSWQCRDNSKSVNSTFFLLITANYMKNLNFYCPYIDYKKSCLFVFNVHKQFVLSESTKYFQNKHGIVNTFSIENVHRSHGISH